MINIVYLKHKEIYKYIVDNIILELYLNMDTYIIYFQILSVSESIYFHIFI